MPRNGSGTFTVPTTFVANTPILSSDMNGNFSDVGAALTASLAIDGQSAMTGQFKAADGSAAAPGISFGSDPNSGIYRIAGDTFGAAANGAEVVRFGTGGVTVASGKTLSVGSNAVDAFPSGTRMLFIQTSAPIGWTKDTTHDNKALRIVSGTAGSGGSVAFTTAFTSKTPAGTLSSTALSVTVPRTGWGTSGGSPGAGSVIIPSGQIVVGSGAAEVTETLESIRASGNDVTASIAAHTHTFTGTAIDLAVQYVDAIIATKD